MNKESLDILVRKMNDINYFPLSGEDQSKFVYVKRELEKELDRRTNKDEHYLSKAIEFIIKNAKENGVYEKGCLYHDGKYYYVTDTFSVLRFKDVSAIPVELHVPITVNKVVVDSFLKIFKQAFDNNNDTEYNLPLIGSGLLKLSHAKNQKIVAIFGEDEPYSVNGVYLINMLRGCNTENIYVPNKERLPCLIQDDHIDDDNSVAGLIMPINKYSVDSIDKDYEKEILYSYKNIKVIRTKLKRL